MQCDSCQWDRNMRRWDRRHRWRFSIPRNDQRDGRMCGMLSNRAGGRSMPDMNTEYERNRAAYERLKESISQTYPHGWFVGIADEQVVGAAADFRALESLLRTQGK